MIKLKETTYNTKKELLRMGAEVEGDSVWMYRGGDVPKETLKKLRYNDYLSTVKDGLDADGNEGASNYGKNVIRVLVPIKDVEYKSGEFQYKGNSSSVKKGKYPSKIYKAYNDVYGSNYTQEQIDKETYNHIRSVASQGLSDGRDEFDRLVPNNPDKEQ